MISLFQRPLYGMLMLATAACLCGDILATEEKKPVSSEVGITILGRGPIHEAYARPTNLPYEPSPAIDKKPPDPIPEEPPNLKPEGDNVLWVPGYWSWDNIGKDWIWVSGFWRVPPPSRKWVPGHWANTEQGWQWAPGFWANADNPDIKYLEPPPASLDIGPGTPQPDADSAYVPGLWVPRENGYAWRPGYWTDIRPGWIWNGGQFVWSPTGTIYVEGYWDYPFEDRGVLFAPVSFSQPLWTNPTWCYRPSWVVGCRGLFPSLFINPSWCSYCFGNYFGSSGFQPWCTFGPRNWDPIFAHARWTNRSNPNWSANLKSQFTTIKNGEAPAPPTTISSGLVGNLSVPKGTSSVSTVKPLVTPLSQANGNGLKLTNLSSAQLAKQQNVIQQNRELSNQRTKIERSTQSLQNAGVSRSTSLKLPWAQPITAAAKTPSGSGKGRLPEIAPGVQILQSGTGAANSLPRVFKGTTEMPAITGSSTRSFSTGPGMALPQIINNGSKSIAPSTSNPAIRTAPAVRPSAPASSSPPVHYGTSHSSFAPPSGGGRVYSGSSSTFGGSSTSHYSGSGGSFRATTLSGGRSGGGGGGKGHK